VHVFTIDTRPPTLAFTFPAEGAVIALPTTPVRLATEAGISVQLSRAACRAFLASAPEVLLAIIFYSFSG